MALSTVERVLARDRMIVVGALLLAVVVVTGSAIAASGGVSPTGSSFLDSLAKHLGISRDKLDDAVQAIFDGRISNALAVAAIMSEVVRRDRADRS